MRYIDVVQRNPKQAGRDLAHEPPRDVNREFVGTGKTARMCRKIIYRKLKQVLELLHFDFVPSSSGV